MSTALQGITWIPNQGLDLQRPKHLVPMSFATEGYDFVVEDNSKMLKRPGYEVINSTQIVASGDVKMLQTLELSNGTTYQLVQAGGTILIDANGVITATAISSQDNSFPWDYAQFLDRGIFVNGSALPFTYNGTISASVSSAPSGAISCCTHLNQLYLFIKGTSQFKYSTSGDIYTWTGANTDTVNVEQNNGQVIVGGRSFARNELVIWKERSMYKFLGSSKSNFNLMSVDTSVGNSCIRATKSFKTSTQGGLLIWPYADGIYVYDGTTPKKISSYIQSFWDTLNATRLEWCDGVIDVDKGRYILTVSLGSGITNTRMIVVDLLHPWTDDNGLHFPIYIWKVSAQSLNLEYVTSTMKQRIVFGTSNGYKNQFTTATSDNGTAIDSYMVTPLMAFNDGIGNENCLRRIYTQFDTTAGTLNYYSNFEDSDDWTLVNSLTISGGTAAIGIDFTIGVSPIGVPVATFSNRINCAVRGRRIKIKIQQNSAHDTYVLNAPVEFYYKGGGQRK